MALATTCPQCKTSFKVVPDQLKLRRGLVRCGACQHVFSGIDYLRYVDESKRADPEATGGPAADADDALQTAFFLPETILAAPQPPIGRAGPRAADQAPVADEAPLPGEPRLPGAAVAPGEPMPPDELITEADLLAFSRDVGPPPDLGDEPLVPMPSNVGEWPGIEVDWSPDTAGGGAPTPIEDVAAPPAIVEPAASPAIVGTGPAAQVDGAVDEALAEANDEDVVESAGGGVVEAVGEGVVETVGEGVDEPIDESSVEAAVAAAIRGDVGTDGAVDSNAEAVAPSEQAGVAPTVPVAAVPIESLTATMPAGFADVGARDDELVEADGADAAAQRPADVHHAARSAGERGAQRVHGGAPGRAAQHDEDESAIDYFSAGHRGVGFIDRHGPLALAGAALLVLALGLQWAIAQRSMIAARLPALAPMIAAAFAPFGLRVELPRDLESLTIESFELQASATPGVLAMSALLRNRADYAVKWPSMQLTLTDPANRVLVRKVLGPDDYLRGSGGADGLPPRAEWPVRLALEAQDLQPAGYSVILFYP